MSSFKDRPSIRPAYVARFKDSLTTINMKSWRSLFTLTSCLMVGLLCLASTNTESASYTVNVSLSSSAVNPSALAQDIVVNLTSGTYSGSSSPSPYFPNTFNVTVKGKNSIPSPSVSTTTVDFAALARDMVFVSSWNYNAGFANGMMYEREHNAGFLGWAMNTFCVPGQIASPTYQVALDTTTCNFVLGFASNYIIQQSSGIAVVP